MNDTHEPVTGLRTVNTNGIGTDHQINVFRKNPSDRYQHIDDLIVDLRRLKEQSALKTSQTKPEISIDKKEIGFSCITSLM